MASSYVVDPDGDVVLLLCRGEGALRVDEEFDVPPPPSNLGYRRILKPEPSESKKKKKKGKSTTAVSWTLTPELTPEPDPGSVQVPLVQSLAQFEEQPPPPVPDSEDLLVRIRVSSKHLMLASSYFQRKLGGELEEAQTLRSKGHVETRMSEQDPDTMLLIMNTIHGRFRQLPSSVDLSALTRIAVLVDYLQCHEFMEPFANKCIEQMEGNVPATYSKEFIQWLCVSLVFHKETLFKAVTCTALRRATGLINTLDLPISSRVAGKKPYYP